MLLCSGTQWYMPMWRQEDLFLMLMGKIRAEFSILSRYHRHNVKENYFKITIYQKTQKLTEKIFSLYFGHAIIS